jgi:hypothetical protein
MPANTTLRDLTTRNPNLPVSRSSKAALKNIAFLYDFLTFNTATQMADVSGNGLHANWDAAPTVSTVGVTCDGARYADCAAGTGDYFDNITGFFVMRHTGAANTRCVMSQFRELAVSPGVAIKTVAGWTPRMFLGSTSNDSNGQGTEASHPNTASNVWRVCIFKVVDGHGLVIDPIAGTQTVTRAWNTNYVAAKPWRIAAGFDGSDAPIFPQVNATLAIAGVIGAVTDEAQDVALLQHLRALMAARGVIL